MYGSNFDYNMLVFNSKGPRAISATLDKQKKSQFLILFFDLFTIDCTYRFAIQCKPIFLVFNLYLKRYAYKCVFLLSADN
jgi:hypothetical protein